MGKKKATSASRLKSMSNIACSTNPLMLPELEPYEFSTTQLKLLKVQHEIKESLSEIMNEFLNDFKTRKERRLASKSPTASMHPYNLVVNKSYQKKIRKQVDLLIISGLSGKLHICVTDCMYKFVENLDEMLKSLTHMSKILQLIFLFDSYHTLQNASNEVAKLISNLYVEKKSSVDYLMNKAFYTKIVGCSQDLMKQAADYDKSHFAIQGVNKMNSELVGIMKKNHAVELNESVGNIEDPSESEGEANESEPLYNLPIEELVTYIEGGKQKTKQQKRRTASTSRSPSSEGYSDLDREIDEFRQRIDIAIKPERPKLKLSQEFLDRLRILIAKGKTN